MKFDIQKAFWIRAPKKYKIGDEKISITTEPFTDLWQRTYYGFQNDNAPVLQIKSKEQFFTFVICTQFDSKHRFDQCGIAVYLDSDNWLKASSEFENGIIQRLGSVVTNNGYSDWATTDIDASIKKIWYRLSRRGSDFQIEYSFDGKEYKQMRICHLNECKEEISFGIYACSPENSQFEAIFTQMEITDCVWKEHC